MANKVSLNDAKSLLDYFGREYTSKTRRPFIVNRHAEKWAARDIVESYGIEDCKRIVMKYMKVADNPSWKNFTYKAQEVYDSMQLEKYDREQRRLLNEQAQEWIEKNA